MRKFLTVLRVVAVLLSIGQVCADDVLPWLQRTVAAARSLNYVGTVLYQSGNQVEVTRLLHLADEEGDYERRIALDGPAREVIRNNEQVTWYFPELQKIRVEGRSRRVVFPALSSEQLATLSQYYSFKEVELGRLAGFGARSYIFEPKDKLRYGYQFWVDLSTGLLLQAKTLNERNQVVEMSMFTDLQINSHLEKEAVLLPPTSARDWVVQDARAPTKQDVTGWQIKGLPPGFHKIRENYRVFTGRREPVVHLIFSDGLAAISVFVERNREDVPVPKAGRLGAINRCSTRLAGYVVTVLGEAPEATMIRIANSVTPP